ncbi:thiamine pyrophosphate-binding protein [Nisaea sediminum]|uniref:thiamine pyrophosphate-binding protein n=1 Tax=Nisaea sediminum TaxID=2775867 RepID=UPI00186947AF|nr:thiamine pyrophosphate-binding protein [Nisaea sediminum]
MSAKKTYEILAEAFHQEQVETCFALLGDANMNWATALAGLGCDFVYVRHEHCAVAAAMAYARSRNTVGVSTVTCGPGLTQVMTALPAAVRAHIPLVVFAGESPLKNHWYNQELEQAPFVKACGADYHALHHPDRMLRQIRDAFVQAQEEMRPVVLGVPFDLQNLDWKGDSKLPAPSRDVLPKMRPMPPHPEDVADMAAVIAEKRKVIVMAGLGALRSEGATEACKALAERCGGLLATTLPVRGMFHDDPFNLSIAGGFSSDVTRECFAEADMVIAVGASLANHNSYNGTLYPNAEVLRIDTAPTTLTQGRITAHRHLRGDAGMSVRALVEALGPRDANAPSWRSPELADRIRTSPADGSVHAQEQGLLDPRDVAIALDAALPKTWEAVNSSGHCSYFFAQMPDRPVENFLTIREFGAIGNGTSFAMGVAAAKPGKPVVMFDGDGSLLMHIQELETMKRHGMKVLICVMNDGAYGSEIHKLRSEGLTDEGAVFGRPDFAAIARGFGLQGETVTDLDTLPDLARRFEASSGPAIWDFHVSDQILSPLMQRAHPK